MNSRLSWHARVSGALAALALAAGLLTATAAPASAEEKACNYNGSTFNVCITIQYEGGGTWHVSVGFDNYMYIDYARQIYNCPRHADFHATLRNGAGTYLGLIPLEDGWPRVGENPSGIYASFAREGWILSGLDKVYATVTYTDCRYYNYRPEFRSGTIKGPF